MHTLSLKISDALYMKIKAEVKKRHVSQSELIRKALEILLKKGSSSSKGSFYNLSQDLCGAVSTGIRDLSSNKDHLKDYGS